jgi:Zn-dependent peptidase ImmA (M78 family)
VNIPEKIRIGSSDYSVVLTDENLVCNGQESYGWIDYNYHLIKINKNIQDKQGQEKTLLHELIHGIVRERSLDVANSNEEIIVEEIAMGLHQVIRDNKNIFEEVNCDG